MHKALLIAIIFHEHGPELFRRPTFENNIIWLQNKFFAYCKTLMILHGANEIHNIFYHIRTRPRGAKLEPNINLDAAPLHGLHDEMRHKRNRLARLAAFLRLGVIKQAEKSSVLIVTLRRRAFAAIKRIITLNILNCHQKSHNMFACAAVKRKRWAITFGVIYARAVLYIHTAMIVVAALDYRLILINPALPPII